MIQYTLYFDGSCGPENPGGTAALGYVLNRQGAESTRGHKVIGTGPEMSNNVAEYAALNHGLAAFEKQPDHPTARLTVCGDSKLVISQMNGWWQARGGLYYQHYREAKVRVRRLRENGAEIAFEWIPRECNSECDALSKAHQ